MEAFFTKRVLYFKVIAVIAIFIVPIYWSLYHFINFKRTLGIDGNVFGYPKQLSEVGFSAFVSVSTLLVAYALIRLLKVGWHSANILGFFGLLMILLEEVHLLSNYIGYFNWIYAIYFLIILFFIIYINNKRIKSLFKIKSEKRFLHILIVLTLVLMWFFCDIR